jgi:hypothetical protein
MERMLDLRTHAGLELLGLLQQPRPRAREVQLASRARLHRHTCQQAPCASSRLSTAR